jgi:hypothetical protein
MSRIDQQRLEAVRLLESLGYVYAHRWTTPANANPIITASGYYSAHSPRHIVNITTEPDQALHGIFLGECTTFADYCLDDAWTAGAWSADGVCLIASSPGVALQLRLTGPCDLADLPQP